MTKAKIIILFLCTVLFLGALTGCGNTQPSDSQPVQTEPQGQTREINPELYDAFGEEFMAEEEKTIKKLVNGLETCYTQYQQNKNFDEFMNSVSKAMEPYKNYLNEITNELQEMYEKETDKQRKIQLLTLQGTSINYVFPESTWSNYKFYIEMGMEPNCTQQEAEEALINYINAISNFFYCKSIAK